MRFEADLVPGVLIRRYKRFLADVRLEVGTLAAPAGADERAEVTAHVPNSGSMKGCAVPGSRVLLSRASGRARKLAWTWELVHTDGTWVGVNTARPNRIVAEAIAEGAIPELAGYGTCRPEQRYGANSRIDLLLEDPVRGRCYVEVKNVTLTDGEGTAMFPDAVTERGAKHLRELSAAVAEGHRAAMVFLVHRGDCKALRAAHEIDPTYARELAAARAAGVEVLAYRCEVTPSEVRVADRVPVA